MSDSFGNYEGDPPHLKTVIQKDNAFKNGYVSMSLMVTHIFK
jgi:hypothetical protein